MDLAVGVIIGGAIWPDREFARPGHRHARCRRDLWRLRFFQTTFIALSSKVTATTLAAAREQGAVFAYGNFITVVINFLILAWIIFLMVKGREHAAQVAGKGRNRRRRKQHRRRQTSSC